MQFIEYITILQTTEYALGKDCYKAEQMIIKKFSNQRYIGPALLKIGNTELFSTDILKLEGLIEC